MRTVVTSQHPFVDLVNSEHRHGPDEITDHLDDTDWVESLLASWGSPASLSKSAVLASLREARSLLRNAIEQLVKGEPLADYMLSKLNSYLVEARGGLLLTNPAPNRFDLVGIDGACNPATLAVRSFAQYLVHDDPRRLKLCLNNNCRLAFHDNSRNRSKRWCSSTACGNLTKVRAFRRRQKGELRRAD